PLGLHAAGEQAEPGNSDFGLRRARNHRALLVAHHDVAQPQCGAPDLVAFEHGAADFNAVLAAEPRLDRRGEPWRDKVDRDRTGAELPPYDAAAHDRGERDRAAADQQLAYERRARGGN